MSAKASSKASLKERARARKSVSLITNKGVPNCSFSSLTEMPSRASWPSEFRSTPPAHRELWSAFTSSGTASHSGASGEAFAVMGASAVIGSHPFRRRYAEQVQSVGEHLACGVVQPQAGAVEVGDRFLAQRGDAAGVIPAVVGPGNDLEVAGHPVGFPQLRGLGHDGGVAAQVGQQL